MERRAFAVAFAVALIGLCIVSKSSRGADDTIKIGYINALSGAFKNDEGLQFWQFIVDQVNARQSPLGKKFELVAFDDKLEPAEALIDLKQVLDQNIPFIMSCSGSHVAAALIDALVKNNEGNPAHRVAFLSCGPSATELTNENCSFWHFRFAAAADQLASARIKTLLTDVKKVYLLNEDFLAGHSSQRQMKRFLREWRPDIEIVGDEFVPLGEVKDFSPYVTRIKQSGAQSLITSNFGADLTLLVKAVVNAGFTIRVDSFFGGGIAFVKEIGPAAADRMTVLGGPALNLPAGEQGAAAEELNVAFRKDHKFDVWSGGPELVMFEMLSRAINEAGSVDAFKVASKLEGMQQKDLLGKTNTMRKDDHQLLLPIYESLLAHVTRYDETGTGIGWKTIASVPADQLAMPTTCKMQRPAS